MSDLRSAVLLRSAFLAIALAFAVFFPLAGPVRAEGDGASIMNWRASTPQPVARQRQNQPAAPYRARRRYDPAPSPAYVDDAVLGLHMPEIKLALPLPVDEARIKVAVIGDSMAEALAIGFEADTGFKIDFLVRQRTSSASGLVRDDYHDWPKAMASLLAQNGDLAAAIVMVGLNDKQALRLGTETLEPFSEPWREAYRRRIDALIALARDAKVSLLWVGMPAMRLPKLSADIMVINDLARERVLAAGQTFIDTMDAFADPAGGFALNGPDVIGDIVRLRGPDGIHFTSAGQRKLAFFVERPLRRLLNARLVPKSEPDIAIAAPVTNEPVAFSAPSAPQSAALQLPASAIAPSVNVILPTALPDGLSIPFERQRPEIGDARPLGERRSANRLIGRFPAPQDGSAPLAEDANRKVFDRGLSPPARAGRADDFSWR